MSYPGHASRNQYQRARCVLKSITYKPGWRIEEDDINDPHYLHYSLRFMAVCAVTGRNEIQVAARHSICLGAESILSLDRMIVNHVLDSIHRAERHETLEFFKVNGVAIYDPHK